jgi:hypothetical protein
MLFLMKTMFISSSMFLIFPRQDGDLPTPESQTRPSRRYSPSGDTCFFLFPAAGLMIGECRKLRGRSGLLGRAHDKAAGRGNEEENAYGQSADMGFVDQECLGFRWQR